MAMYGQKDKTCEQRSNMTIMSCISGRYILREINNVMPIVLKKWTTETLLVYHLEISPHILGLK
jgi:hypothetical protein